MFRMLDKDWISLSPNRRDCRPYRGSNYENEKFYGGRSVVFSVPTDFFGKRANGVNVQLDVRKQVCKYFEMVSRQRIGFATVSVDNMLKSIAKQIRERNELAEHLSDYYKRQIISRSMMGTYTLLDDNFRNTAATISLYIRISYLGKCLITEITQVKSVRGAFYTRGDSDEKPYLTWQLTSKELQSGCWVDSGLPHVPLGRLICRCEELVKKEVADLAKIAVDSAAIPIPKIVDAKARKGKAPDIVADSALISVPKDIVDVATIKREKALADAAAKPAATTVAKVADTAVIKKRKRLVDATEDSAAIAADVVAINQEEAPAVANSAAIPVVKVTKDVAVKEKELDDAIIDSTVIPIAKIDTNATIIETRKAPAYGELDNRIDTGAYVNALAYETTRIPIIATNSELINGEQASIRRKDFIESVIKDVKVDAAATAKTKGRVIKDNGERAFKKAFSASSKSKRERNTTTIGITERRKRILLPPSPPFPRLQTYPLCCQLQPHLTCFTDCFDISPCYCYCGSVVFNSFTVHKRIHEHHGTSSFTATS